MTIRHNISSKIFISQVDAYTQLNLSMSQFRNIFSKRFLKVVLGASTLGGFGYIAYNQLSANAVQDTLAGKKTQQILTTSQLAPLQQSNSSQVQKNNEVVAPESTVRKNDAKDQNEAVQAQSNPEEGKHKQIIKEAFSKVKQIGQFAFPAKFNDGEMILIVADLPFTPEFEEKILAQVNKLKSKFKSLKVYRKDILSEQARQYFQKEFKAKIEDHTLFLLRNEYDKGLNYFNFDMYMQYPVLLETYLRDISRFEESDIGDLKEKLASLSPYESCTIYLYDKEEPKQKMRERMMTAKFVEMELIVNNLNGVKLFAVEKSAAIKSGLIDQKNSRANSLHLFRKHNIYTPFDPNFSLALDDQQTLPFFRLSDIALFQSGSNRLMIPNYLAGLETFDSFESTSPYMCTLRVDRNKITDEDYNALLRIFGELKRRNIFPDVGFSLKLKEVPYAGKGRPKNKEWQITLSNVDEIDKQNMMHEITQEKQLRILGFKEETYMKTRPQYIYEHGVIDKQAIEQFLAKGVKGQLPKYYKSEEKHPLSNIRPTTGKTFSKDILEDGKDHIVYEYSEYCPTCKKISPYLSLLVEYIQKKGLGLQDIEFHRLDANKNRVHDYVSSPYIPNLYYFKHDWKVPARFPIEFLSGHGIGGLYHFCLINKEVKTVPWQMLDSAIDQHQKCRNELLQL